LQIERIADWQLAITIDDWRILRLLIEGGGPENDWLH